MRPQIELTDIMYGPSGLFLSIQSVLLNLDNRNGICRESRATGKVAPDVPAEPTEKLLPVSAAPN